MNRPPLGELFKDEIIKDKRRRDKRMREAVQKYGYSQMEIAEHLGMHYSTISRLMREEGGTSKYKT